MDLGIKGKKALVTGGARGIGQAIALDLAKEGVKVVITSRSSEKNDDALALLNEYGSGHYSIAVDLNEVEGPKTMARTIEENFGLLDIVVNNVGDTLEKRTDFAPIEDWKLLYRLNLEVAIEINNIYIPHMKEQDWGRIVNITAGAALENSGPVPYCSMKSAMTAYSRSTGRLLATHTNNVVMTALLPGVIKTKGGYWDEILQIRPEHAEKYLKERTPLKRFGEPEEISAMAVFLCSQQASFCHASVILLDAGQGKHYVNIEGM